MNELITLEEYKTYKGIKTTEDDGRIIQIAAHVSKLVKNFCNRDFIDYYTDEKVEYFDGKYKNVFLREFPIRDVTSVEISDDGGETFEALTQYTDYYVEPDDAEIFSAYSCFSRTIPTRNTLKVTYRGGFQECPEDLKIACFDIVEYYREEEYIPKKVMSGATSDNEVFRLMRSERFPIHIQRVLNLYRMVV